ncbi:Putative membrane protein [Minicystis rosea]|nr:Putative membrane protein [Minicystis rosea]
MKKAHARWISGLGVARGTLLALLGAAIFTTLLPILARPAAGDEEGLSLSQGPRVKILDTTDLPEGKFYVNDHSLLRLEGGRWILTGIFHRDGKYESRDEREFVLATAESSEPSQWYSAESPAFSIAPERLALRAADDEPWIWAPHLARDDDGSLVMIYHAGVVGPDRAAFHLARSRDGITWTREGETLFEDICVARDPMLFRLGPSWMVYYTRCADKASPASGVAYRLSVDLHHWTEPVMALTLSTTRFDSGHTESPFVFQRHGWFYLTVTSYPVAGDATFVYRSRSPFSFPPEPVARLSAHAAEWVAEGGDFENGRLFFTHVGPGQGGVWLSELFGL